MEDIQSPQVSNVTIPVKTTNLRKKRIIEIVVLLLIILPFIYLISLQFPTKVEKKQPVEEQKTIVGIPTGTVTGIPNAAPDMKEADACDFRSNGGTSPDSIKEKTVEELPYLDGAYVDLGGNSLSMFDYGKINKNRVKQISLIRNNFSKEEQEKIKKELPNVEVYFYPQLYEKSIPDATWKTYTSKKKTISFSYPSALHVTEEYKQPYSYNDANPSYVNYIYIENPFTAYEYYWKSCASMEGYISLTIAWEDTSDNRTMEQYIEEKWDIPLEKKNGKYYVPENIGMMRMIGEVEDFTAGSHQGIYIRAGEATNLFYILKLQGRFYNFTMNVGGETGSEVGDFPKALMLQIIGSIKAE